MKPTRIVSTIWQRNNNFPLPTLILQAYGWTLSPTFSMKTQRNFNASSLQSRNWQVKKKKKNLVLMCIIYHAVYIALSQHFFKVYQLTSSMPRDLWIKISKPCCWENTRDRCSAAGKQIHHQAAGFLSRAGRDGHPSACHLVQKDALTPWMGLMLVTRKTHNLTWVILTSPWTPAQPLRLWPCAGACPGSGTANPGAGRQRGKSTEAFFPEGNGYLGQEAIPPPKSTFYVMPAVLMCQELTEGGQSLPQDKIWCVSPSWALPKPSSS